MNAADGAYDTDLLVIGGGRGDVRAARMAAPRRARRAGGGRWHGRAQRHLRQCRLHPKKLYSYAAHYAEAFEESHGFGWRGNAPTLNWGRLKENRRKELAKLNGVYLQLLVDSGVEVDPRSCQAAGCAPGRDRFRRSRAGRPPLQRRHLLIATGERPPGSRVSRSRFSLTSNGSVFDLEPFPRRLLVVGGGYIACEFASSSMDWARG